MFSRSGRPDNTYNITFVCLKINIFQNKVVSKFFFKMRYFNYFFAHYYFSSTPSIIPSGVVWEP